MAVERPLHVLMTADCVGGVWTHALELAAGLGTLGVRVTLASMGAPLTAAQRAQAAGIPALSLHESTWRLEWMDDPWDDVAAAGRWLQQLEQALVPTWCTSTSSPSAPCAFVRRHWWSRIRACCRGGARCAAAARR